MIIPRERGVRVLTRSDDVSWCDYLGRMDAYLRGVVDMIWNLSDVAGYSRPRILVTCDDPCFVPVLKHEFSKRSFTCEEVTEDMTPKEVNDLVHGCEVIFTPFGHLVNFEEAYDTFTLVALFTNQRWYNQYLDLCIRGGFIVDFGNSYKEYNDAYRN